MNEKNKFWQSQVVHVVTHRERGIIPDCTPAQDITTFTDDGHIVIKNPSKPRKGNYYVT